MKTQYRQFRLNRQRNSSISDLLRHNRVRLPLSRPIRFQVEFFTNERSLKERLQLYFIKNQRSSKLNIYTP